MLSNPKLQNVPIVRQPWMITNIILFHEKECVYQPTKCPDCSATMLLKDADSHFCKPAKENNKGNIFFSIF